MSVRISSASISGNDKPALQDFRFLVGIRMKEKLAEPEKTSNGSVSKPTVRDKSTHADDDPRVAGWGRHLTPVKQTAGTGGLARFNPQGS